MQTNEDQLRAQMVTELVQSGRIVGAATKHAFSKVPRHRFLPEYSPAVAYGDTAVNIAFEEVNCVATPISSASQPSIMATMIELLDLRPGMRVLEIGTGSGYNAALLAEIVGQENVFSIDIDRRLVDRAMGSLRNSGYADVSVVCGDGWHGYAQAAPYDRIIVTAGANDVSPLWIQQLKTEGILLLPFSLQCVQLLVAFHTASSKIISQEITRCGFMGLRGSRTLQTLHSSSGGAQIVHDNLSETFVARIDETLSRNKFSFESTELQQIGPRMLDFLVFLCLAHPFCVYISDPRLDACGIPKGAFTFGIFDPSLCELAIPGTCFGGMNIGEQMSQLLQEWSSLGSPGVGQLVIAGEPKSRSPEINSHDQEVCSRPLHRENYLFNWKYNWKYKR